MNTEDRHLETKVGIFVLIGLAVTAVMVIHFGRLGEGFRSYMDITVEFDNAAGLLRDSDVLFGGAKIGFVSSRPRISHDLQALENATTGVVVDLKIYSDVEVPSSARFQVGSSGLLGDRFVDVIPPDKFDPADILKEGAVVAGRREAGIDDITREGTELIIELRGTVTRIDTAVSRVEDQLLTNSNLENVSVTLANLRQTTESLQEFGGKLNVFMDDAGEVVRDAGGAMDTAEEALISAKNASEEIAITITEARAAVEMAKRIVNDALEGDGLLARMLLDDDLSNDLTSLIANLRRHGILFYRDSSAPETEMGIPVPGESREGRSVRSGHPGR